MQLILTLETNGITDIPVNYNYYVQSAIFALLATADAEYSANLHDTAYGGKAKFKFFTFDKLRGKCHFYEKKLFFESDIRLEIRSISPRFMQILTDAVMKTGQLRIGKHTLKIKNAECKNDQITNSVVKIRTLTPIIAKAITEDRKTIYYPPDDVRFNRCVREAFERKFDACCGEFPSSSVDILLQDVPSKCVTQVKDIWITAYNGIFQLCGEPAHLQFLHDVGLGVKTSQGFGLFTVL